MVQIEHERGSRALHTRSRAQPCSALPPHTDTPWGSAPEAGRMPWGSVLGEVGVLPTRVRRPRRLRRGAYYPGCCGPSKHIPSGGWSCDGRGSHSVPWVPGPHSPRPTHQNNASLLHLDSPGPLRQEPPRRKGNFRKQAMPLGFSPVLSVCRVVGKEFTLPGTRYQS